MSSSTSPSEQSQVPWICAQVGLGLLPVLGLYCPPFRGRGVLFSLLIGLDIAATTVSPWPSKTGDTRPLKYGMAGSWFFTLPALARLMLLTPERDCWGLEDGNKPDHGRPRECSLGKLRWAAALFITPRGVGWNIGSRRLNAQRDAIAEQRPSRARFLVVKLVRAALAYVAVETAEILAHKAVIPPGWGWDGETLRRNVWAEVLMAVASYATMSMQFDIAAAVGVGLFLSGPQDWPPLFGDLFDCFTVANFWGKFWHGYIRQPCLAFSHRIIEVLHVSRRSNFAYLVHLTTAFTLSAFFHCLGIGPVWPSSRSLADLVAYMAVFFLSQPVAVMAEVAVIRLGSRLLFGPTPAHDSPAALSEAPSRRRGLRGSKYFKEFVAITSRLVGHAWVACWFVLTGWPFVRAYLDIGILEWPLPFSIVGRMLEG